MHHLPQDRFHRKEHIDGAKDTLCMPNSVLHSAEFVGIHIQKTDLNIARVLYLLLPSWSVVIMIELVCICGSCCGADLTKLLNLCMWSTFCVFPLLLCCHVFQALDCALVDVTENETRYSVPTPCPCLGSSLSSTWRKRTVGCRVQLCRYGAGGGEGAEGGCVRAGQHAIYHKTIG